MKFRIKEPVCATTAVLLALMVSGVMSLATAGTTLDVISISDINSTSCTTFCALDDKFLGGINQPEFCSVLTASCGEKVLFGGNVDIRSQEHLGTTPYIFIFPPSEKENRYGSGYGFVAIGRTWKENGRNYESYLGVINEKGLALGTNGLPAVSLNPHPERPFSTSSESFRIRAMRECSNVDCVIELAKTFDWGSSSSRLNQHHFADSTGDAVIISAGRDGELAFTRKEKKDGYLISTNFNRANPANGRFPCWRYSTAAAMLGKIENGDDLTIPYFESVLDAIHQEGALLNTAYSYIFDLRTGDGYIYYFHQFEEVVEFNVSVELAETPEGTTCSLYAFDRLFSQETKSKATSEFWEYQKQIIVLKIAFGVAALSGFCFFIYRKMRSHTSE